MTAFFARPGGPAADSWSANFREPRRRTGPMSSLSLRDCSDEVTGAEFAVISPRPSAAPGDMDVAEHHWVGAFGVDAYRGVLDLQVQVRLAGMTVVANCSERLPTSH